MQSGDLPKAPSLPRESHRHQHLQWPPDTIKEVIEHQLISTNVPRLWLYETPITGWNNLIIGVTRIIHPARRCISFSWQAVRVPCWLWRLLPASVQQHPHRRGRSAQGVPNDFYCCAKCWSRGQKPYGFNSSPTKTELCLPAGHCGQKRLRPQPPALALGSWLSWALQSTTSSWLHQKWKDLGHWLIIIFPLQVTSI